jgi:subtilisin family serine protease
MTLTPGSLDRATLAPRTGAGVCVVVIDSGVHVTHPHVGGVAGGIGVLPDGSLEEAFDDRLGHGTAVTAVIREKAPAARILVVRVFRDRLETTVDALVSALRWAARQRAQLVNLSLGTAVPAHARRLQEAVREAREAGAWVVAAGPQGETRWLPGSLAQVVSVSIDWSLHRDQVLVDEVTPETVRVRASGLPRPIPGVSPERNLKGLSFAVANVTGLLALACEDAGVQRAAPVSSD